MDAETLFLHRCQQLNEATKPTDELSMVDAAAKLRQLLLDSSALIHKANANHRLKLQFAVGDFRNKPDAYTAILSLEDGLDPTTRPPGSPEKILSLDGFLGHPIVYLHTHPHSVRDVIKLCSDVLGGVHLTNNPKERQRLLADYSSSVSIGGLPGAIRQMAAICRVTLKGLEPLIYKIESAKNA
jgi:hypothetical protein